MHLVALSGFWLSGLLCPPLPGKIHAESPVLEKLPRLVEASPEYQTCRTATDDYDHGNHRLARATLRPADPGLVSRASLSALALPDTDASIIDELAQASDTTAIMRVLADAALVDRDRRARSRRSHWHRRRVFQRLLRRPLCVCARRRHLRWAQPTPTPRPAQRRPVLRLRDPPVRIRRRAARRRARTIPRYRVRAHRQTAQPGAGPHGPVPPTPGRPNRHDAPAHAQTPARTRRSLGRGWESLAGRRRQDNPRRRGRGRITVICRRALPGYSGSWRRHITHSAQMLARAIAEPDYQATRPTTNDGNASPKHRNPRAIASKNPCSNCASTPPRSHARVLGLPPSSPTQKMSSTSTPSAYPAPTMPTCSVQP